VKLRARTPGAFYAPFDLPVPLLMNGVVVMLGEFKENLNLESLLQECFKALD
jgi:hypothetical protein